MLVGVVRAPSRSLCVSLSPIYITLRVTVAVWLVDDEVPVIVIVELPDGVPPVGVCGLELLLQPAVNTAYDRST